MIAFYLLTGEHPYPNAHTEGQIQAEFAAGRTPKLDNVPQVYQVMLRSCSDASLPSVLRLLMPY